MRGIWKPADETHSLSKDAPIHEAGGGVRLQDGEAWVFIRSRTYQPSLFTTQFHPIAPKRGSLYTSHDDVGRKDAEFVTSSDTSGHLETALPIFDSDKPAIAA